jgi:hypothetical protein
VGVGCEAVVEEKDSGRVEREEGRSYCDRGLWSILTAFSNENGRARERRLTIVE